MRTNREDVTRYRMTAKRREMRCRVCLKWLPAGLAHFPWIKGERPHWGQRCRACLAGQGQGQG